MRLRYLSPKDVKARYDTFVEEIVLRHQRNTFTDSFIAGIYSIRASILRFRAKRTKKWNPERSYQSAE